MPVAELSAFLQVVMIDLVLAGDNAIVVGLAASGVAREHRARLIMLGIAAATVLRILFALVTTQLLAIIGLTLAGGILLLWVCWKLWRELRTFRRQDEAIAKLEEDVGDVLPTADDPLNLRPARHSPEAASAPGAPQKTFFQAATQIVIADVSMSLDNVLAVAGVAREHAWVLVAGLVLSVALMGSAAALVAGLLKRWPWLSYAGLAIIFYVAVKMIFEGWVEVANHMAAA